MNLHQRGMIEIRNVRPTSGHLLITIRQRTDAPPCPVQLRGLGTKYAHPADDTRTLVCSSPALEGGELAERITADIRSESWTVAHYDDATPDAAICTYDAVWRVRDYHEAAAEGELDLQWLIDAYLAAMAVGVETRIDDKQGDLFADGE